jgi:mRNA-degrading endonuclease RelE of RelBE toxin-antitoxin system
MLLRKALSVVLSTFFEDSANLLLKLSNCAFTSSAVPLDTNTSLTYLVLMEFIETPEFSALLYRYLTENEYSELQRQLVERPDRAPVIRGSGGVRKLRFAARGSGKSGGVRIIYYWLTAAGQVYLLYLYAKGKKDDLSENEVAALKVFVKQLSQSIRG